MSNIEIQSGKFTAQNVRATTNISNTTTEDALSLIDDKTGVTMTSETKREDPNGQVSIIKGEVVEIR